MTDNLTWKMAADYLEEKGFDEQAAAIRTLAGFASVETYHDAENRRSILSIGMDDRVEMLGDLSGYIQFVRGMLRSLESRQQAEYDIIQRDEARMRQIPNGGV